MATLLGIDTGGTFTDAVVLDRGAEGGRGKVLGFAKSRTTHDGLHVGIGNAIENALANAAKPPEHIDMVSLSTTLATNALAEGRTDSTALVLIGFDKQAVRRSGIDEFGDASRTLLIEGGHDAAGEERAPLDLAALAGGLDRLEGAVDALAVVGMFAVRNPSHERRARDAIQHLARLPSTCSHELTAELDGPRRALTTYLNAGLIPRIEALLDACGAVLRNAGIQAPAMVVRGDGSLMNIATARAYPVHTILSGPAASATGAHYLSGRGNAVVSDIGGTTTDIAILNDGEVRVDPRGSLVRGRRTFVRAVDMRTHALGGDSEVGVEEEAREPCLKLGPRRAVPVTEFSRQQPDLVRNTLRRQLESDRPDESHGRFAEITSRGIASEPASVAAREVLDLLAGGPQPEDRLARNRRWLIALNRLRDQGRVRIAAFTPTDALEVKRSDGGPARQAADLLARRRDRRGREAARSPDDLAANVLAVLHRQSSRAVLASALDHDGLHGEKLACSAFADASMDRRKGLVDTRIRLRQPLIAVGASAALHYPDVARELGADLVCPPFAEVANAVGAAVGGVSTAVEIVVLQPQAGRFVLHGTDSPQHFDDLDRAAETAARLSREMAAQRAGASGATDIMVGVEEERRTAKIESEEMLVELRVRATARGLPKTRTGPADRPDAETTQLR